VQGSFVVLTCVYLQHRRYLPSTLQLGGWTEEAAEFSATLVLPTCRPSRRHTLDIFPKVTFSPAGEWSGTLRPETPRRSTAATSARYRSFRVHHAPRKKILPFSACAASDQYTSATAGRLSRDAIPATASSARRRRARLNALSSSCGVPPARFREHISRPVEPPTRGLGNA
jgi:hypothetical protein